MIDVLPKTPTTGRSAYTKKFGRFASLAFGEKLLWETFGRPLAALPNVEVEERHQGALPLSWSLLFFSSRE